VGQGANRGRTCRLSGLNCCPGQEAEASGPVKPNSRREIRQRGKAGKTWHFGRSRRWAHWFRAHHFV